MPKATLKSLIVQLVENNVIEKRSAHIEEYIDEVQDPLSRLVPSPSSGLLRCSLGALSRGLVNLAVIYRNNTPV